MKKMNGLKKWTTMMVLSTQFLMPLIAHADSSEEVNLLSTIIGISGQDLKPTEAEEQIEEAVRYYDQASPADGREQRIGQAFVDLKIMTPSQWDLMNSSLNEEIAEAKASKDANSTNAVIYAIGENLQNLHGAQFSACPSGNKTAFAAAAVLAAAGIGSLAVGSQMASTPTHIPAPKFWAVFGGASAIMAGVIVYLASCRPGGGETAPGVSMPE